MFSSPGPPSSKHCSSEPPKSGCHSAVPIALAMSSADGSRIAIVADWRRCSIGGMRGTQRLRSYYQKPFVKQYEKGNRLLRTETCVNNTHHVAIGRRLPALKERLAATNIRYLEARAELLASTVDAGHLAALAQPSVVGQRRIPGIKLQDDRVIRLVEVLLHPGSFVADWTTHDVHTRLLARHRVLETDYRFGQLRYDLAKLRAKGMVERLGKSRRYRLTLLGLKLGVLLVKLRLRLLGPLDSLVADPTRRRPTRNPSQVEEAFRQLDTALDHLCDALGLVCAAYAKFSSGQQKEPTLLLRRGPEAVAPNGADRSTLALWPTS